MAPHKAVHTEHAPAALGPYSQAVALDRNWSQLLFLAGQVPLVPETGEVLDGSIEAQVHRVMKNLGAVLEAAGSGFDRAVKATIFLADFDDFAAVNAVYGEYFESTPPARSTIEVSRLPKDVKVEIDLIAYA